MKVSQLIKSAVFSSVEKSQKLSESLDKDEKQVLEKFKRDCEFALKMIKEIEKGKLTKGVEGVIYGSRGDGGLKTSLDKFAKIFGHYMM